MNRPLVLVIILAFAGLLGWRIYGKLGSEEEMRQRGGAAVAVDVEPVRMMTLRDVRTFTGSLRANSAFVVAPKISGRLERLTVHIGDPVERGQLVARLEDEEHVQQVEQAKAELEVVEARAEQCRTQLSLADREYDRAKELREKKISSQSEYDAAESEYKTRAAELRVVLAQKDQRAAALRAAEVRLGYTRIHAAWENGSATRYVGERFVDEGEMLTANTPVLTIVDIKQLKAIVHVTERDYPQMRAGQEATLMTDAFPGETFPGEILRVAKVLKETSREAVVEVRVSNEDLRLKPGMFLRVRVAFAARENARVIPRQALVRHHDAHGVFRLADGGKTVDFVPLETGIREGDWVEVLTPALEGRVVTLGHHLLRDGAPVVVHETEAAAGSQSKGGDPGRDPATEEPQP